MKKVEIIHSDLSETIGQEIYHVIVEMEDGRTLMGSFDHNPLTREPYLIDITKLEEYDVTY